MELQEHQSALEAQGITKVAGLIPAEEARAARHLVCELAAEHRLYTPEGWQRADSRFGLDKRFRRALNALNLSERFPKLITPSLLELVETLLGEPVTQMPPGQQVLFTLPGREPWSVPHDVWHVDAPRLGPLGPPGLQVFAFLDDVAPQGGGTLVVSGSHRLCNTSGVIRSKDLKRRLGAEPYFRHLFDGKRTPLTRLQGTAGSVDGVDLEVIELTGQVGDVYLMDLRALHTPAPNASDVARMMLTCRLPRAAVAGHLFAPETG